MSEGFRGRVLAMALLTILLLAAAMVIAPLNGIGSLVGRGAPHVSASSERGPVPGVLLIDVSYERRSTSAPLMGLISRYEPMKGATIMISRTDQLNSPPLTAVTNRTGFLRFRLQPSENYMVTLMDARINVTVPVRIFGERITSLIIRANRISYRVLLEDIRDGGLSGWMTPWQKLFLETPDIALETRVKDRLAPAPPTSNSGWRISRTLLSELLHRAAIDGLA